MNFPPPTKKDDRQLVQLMAVAAESLIALIKSGRVDKRAKWETRELKAMLTRFKSKCTADPRWAVLAKDILPQVEEAISKRSSK